MQNKQNINVIVLIIEKSKTMERYTKISKLNNNSGIQLINSKLSDYPLLVAKANTKNSSGNENVEPSSSQQQNKIHRMLQMKKININKKLNHKPRVVVFSKLRVELNKNNNNNDEHQQVILYSKSNINIKQDQSNSCQQKTEPNKCLKSISQWQTISNQKEEKQEEKLEIKRENMIKRLTQNRNTTPNNNTNSNIVFSNSDILSVFQKKTKNKEQISQQDYEKIRKVISYQQNQKQKITNFISLPPSPTKRKQMIKKKQIIPKPYDGNYNRGFTYEKSRLVTKVRNTSYENETKSDKNIKHNLTNNAILQPKKQESHQLPPINSISKYFSSQYIPKEEIVKKSSCRQENKILNDLPIQTNRMSRKLLETIKKFCQTESKEVRKYGGKGPRMNIPPINFREIEKCNKTQNKTLKAVQYIVPTTIEQAKG